MFNDGFAYCNLFLEANIDAKVKGNLAVVEQRHLHVHHNQITGPACVQICSFKLGSVEIGWYLEQSKPENTIRTNY